MSLRTQVPVPDVRSGPPTLWPPCRPSSPVEQPAGNLDDGFVDHMAVVVRHGSLPLGERPIVQFDKMPGTLDFFGSRGQHLVEHRDLSRVNGRSAAETESGQPAGFLAKRLEALVVG